MHFYFYCDFGKNRVSSAENQKIKKNLAQGCDENFGAIIFTPYNLIVSFLLTAGHDTDGCRINTMFQLDEGKKMIFF